MNLVREYLDLATSIISDKEFIGNIDFSKFRKNYNSTVTRMREIATEIEKNYPEHKDEFCKLLFHECNGVRIWVSHHVLEVMNCKRKYRKAALREIRKIARNDKSADGLGEKLWLKDWYKSHPKDFWLR